MYEKIELKTRDNLYLEVVETRRSIDRYITVRNQYGITIKTFVFQKRNRGKGQAAQRREHINKARNWAYQYNRLARYNKDVKMKCDNIYFLHNSCPNLRIADDHTARCNITPYMGGYGGGGDVNRCRSIPEDHICDLFKKLGLLSRYDWEIQGNILKLREYWECYNGEAIEKLERRPRKAIDWKDYFDELKGN